eukprot:TRINITY_DN910_c0_g3_i1.p1 TRINITY_DN910_c0_g3~~TRINITY_DN910_c0_g3_i1.p1  ORF type:complete len:303 (-),score=82.85 TRINITY_DN910_c0_g3_i1:822-1730(-)
MEGCKRFIGKHVIVTGSNGGIGSVLARDYLKEGANVSLFYNNKNEEIEKIKKEYPNNTKSFSCNLSDEKKVEECMKGSVEAFGVPHILIPNHAIFVTQDKPIWEMELDQFKNTLDVNLVSVFLIVREYMRAIKSALDNKTIEKTHDCSITIIGSTAGKFGEFFHVDYSCSKSALMYGFILSLKNEIVLLLPRARINCVAPGWTLTEMAKASVEKGEHYKALLTTPLSKIATCQEVSDAVIYFSLATHTTGQILMIDGGMEGRVMNTLEKQFSHVFSKKQKQKENRKDVAHLHVFSDKQEKQQ